MEQTNTVVNAAAEEIEKTASEKILVDEVIEEVIIYDECGDTLWDPVLAQDEKNTSINNLIIGTQAHPHPAK